MINIARQFKNLSWYKPDWPYMSPNKESLNIIQQCTKLHPVVFSGEIEDVIKRSKTFPIPFPIETVRLEQLKTRLSAEELTRNIISTYPVLHERVLILMAIFLNYKREFGSDIEKVMYTNMSVPQLVDRILTKRAVTFMNAQDSYLLLTGEKGVDGWEAVGTAGQAPPLLLDQCLSYDEMKLSALVCVSGHTACINDGARTNRGVVSECGVQQRAVIIGVIGTRLEREGRMDWEDILVTKQQNREESDLGRSGEERQAWRRLWSDFYQIPYRTYEEVASSLAQGADAVTARYVGVGQWVMFDNEVYYKRLVILAETILLEAQARGDAAGKHVYVNVIGAGLGVWKISPHQKDVYILSFVQTVHALLEKGLLTSVSDVNFAYIRPGERVQGLFENSTSEGESSNVKKMFLSSEKHPKGGINVQMENREPSSQLLGQHADKLLVITYPWDGNAHPGNEFWLGSLSGSGDPAAACSTQVAELHNAHINPALSGLNTRVAGRAGSSTLADCCLALTAQ